MATTFKNAPYVLLPGANTLASVRGVQDSVTMLQDLLNGKPLDKYESPSEIIRMRESTFKTNVAYLENVLKPTMYVYTGFIDRPLLQEYVDYAKSTFVKENFVVPADVYGQAMIYNPDNGAFKIQSAVTPVATSPIAPPVTLPVVTPIAPAPLPAVKTELPSVTPSVVNNFYVSGSNNVVNSLVAVNSTITGTSGADELVGTEVAETIKGGFGADVLKGGLGDDILIGNQDNDQLFGG